MPDDSDVRSAKFVSEYIREYTSKPFNTRDNTIAAYHRTRKLAGLDRSMPLNSKTTQRQHYRAWDVQQAHRQSLKPKDHSTPAALAARAHACGQPSSTYAAVHGNAAADAQCPDRTGGYMRARNRQVVPSGPFFAETTHKQDYQNTEQAIQAGMLSRCKPESGCHPASEMHVPKPMAPATTVYQDDFVQLQRTEDLTTSFTKQRDRQLLGSVQIANGTSYAVDFRVL